MDAPWQSVVAYQHIFPELPKVRADVLHYFISSGVPRTKGEVNMALGKGRPNPSYHRRVDELVKHGLLRSTGKFRPCQGAATNDVSEEFELVPEPMFVPLPKTAARPHMPTPAECGEALAVLRQLWLAVAPDHPQRKQVAPSLTVLTGWLKWRSEKLKNTEH